MKFEAAYNYLKRGHKIKLPEWGGYWYWNAETNSIRICTRNDEHLDIRETDNLDYTMSFTFRDDWLIVNDNDGMVVYDIEEATNYIQEEMKGHEDTGVTKDVIRKILECEESYMRSIGIIIEEG